MFSSTKEQLQRTCAVFLSALSKFKEAVPSSHMESVNDEIMATFLAKFFANESSFNVTSFSALLWQVHEPTC